MSMYNARGQDEILAELQKNTNTAVSSFEGTFIYDAFAANSIEFAKQEVEREQTYKVAFAKTSWGEYLEMRTEEHGISRKQAVKASGVITVKGNGTVPIGSIFQTPSGLTYQTTKPATIAVSGDIPIECTTAGAVGNTKAGTIINIPMSIPGINSVSNADDVTDGYDEETDAALYNRFIFKVRQPATSGNMNDYIEWATSVPGVGSVKILPLWNGNGTVKVLITDVNGAPASEKLIQQVTDLVEQKHPIGATVTVAAPEMLELHIALTLSPIVGDVEVIKKIINDYFISRSFSKTRISPAKVGQLILDNADTTGITDYDSLLINGSTVSISIDEDKLPLVVEVTINDH